MKHFSKSLAGFTKFFQSSGFLSFLFFLITIHNLLTVIRPTEKNATIDVFITQPLKAKARPLKIVREIN